MISLLLLLAMTTAVAAEQPSLPACAISCLEAFVNASSLVDEASALTTLAMPDLCMQSPSPATQYCLLQQCSPADSLDTVRFVAHVCHWPVRSRKVSLLALFAIQIPAVACLGLRLYDRAKHRGARRYAVDDYLVMAVAPLFLVFLTLGQYASIIAFGVDIWTVSDRKIASAMRAFYIDEMLYLAILALIRLSILFLYLRLFAPPPEDTPAVPKRSSAASAATTKTTTTRATPPESPESPVTARFRHRYRTVYYRRFRMAVFAIAFALVALPTVVFFFLDTFQCRPINTVWTRWISASSLLSIKTTSTCLNVRALAYVAASFGILQDVAILLVPWPLLFVLRHSLFSSLRSAAALTALAMFSLGIFVLITSCIRLHFLVHFNPATTTNPTWDNTDSLIWSGLEVSISVIVASLPTVRAMVQTAYRGRHRG